MFYVSNMVTVDSFIPYITTHFSSTCKLKGNTMTMFKIYFKNTGYPTKTEKCEYFSVLHKEKF